MNMLFINEFCDGVYDRNVNIFIELKYNILKQEIRSVEHGICPIAEFTSPLLSCAAILAIRP